MPILKLLNAFFGELYDVQKEMSFTNIQKINNRRIYRLMIKGNFQQMSSDLELHSISPHHLLNSTENRRAYLVGSFLSGGSINSVEGNSHHLEIRSTKVNYLRLVQKILHEFNISMSLLQRKNIYILYIKKNIDISDFLKIIGANEAMQE
jgi:DNA-binding protein WhiA